MSSSSNHFSLNSYSFIPILSQRKGLKASRYGFNGKEKLNELEGEGDAYDYGMRMYDVRLGRFLSVDPLTKKYPELSTYQFASNTCIVAIDLDGLEAKISIYGAGVKQDKTGKIVETHETIFKKEAERDVSWGNATNTYAAHTGEDLVTSLVKASKSQGGIEYLSIFSHSSNVNIILDNGQYGHQTLGYNEWKNYVLTKLSDVLTNPDIKFTPDALIVFGGCNAGRQLKLDRKTQAFNLAQSVTEKYGIATIGADGYTSPQGENQIRTADYNYVLNYKDENGELQKVSLGKELNKEAITKAKNILKDVEKKKANKKDQ